MTADDVLQNPETVAIPQDPKELFKLVKDLGAKLSFRNFDQVVKFFDRIPLRYAIHCVAVARKLETGNMSKASDQKERDKLAVQTLKKHPGCQRWMLDHYTEMLEAVPAKEFEEAHK